MKNKQNDRIDAGTARELLNVHFPQEKDTGSDAEAWLWWYVQTRLINDEQNPNRAKRLAQAHFDACSGSAEAEDERQKLIDEIYREGQAALEKRLEEISSGQRAGLWS